MSPVDPRVLALAQKRFADLNHVPVGLAVLDSGLNVLYWNSSLEDWTGIPSSTSVGQVLPDLNPEWTRSHYFQRLSGLFEGGPPVIFSPLLHSGIVPQPEGAGRSFHVTATAVPAEDGWWAFLSVENVTTLWRRIEELRTMRAQQDRLMREIHHRVKNNLNMISSLITLQKARADEGIENAFDDLQSRIVAIAEIHDLLYHSANLAVDSTSRYLETLAQLLDTTLSFSKTHRLVLDLDPSIVLKTDTTVILGLAQAELMTNALKYGLTSPDSELTIRFFRSGPGEVKYELAHSGDRLPEGFDPSTSEGLGMVLLSAYAGQLGTSLEWARGDPTRFWLRFRE